MKGIDVSTHNGLIDWEKVAATPIEFAIIRAGYGMYENQIDTRFRYNIENALANKLHVGVYWFSYAGSAEESIKEAQLCAKVIEPYKGKIDFPVYFDFEYDSERYLKEHGIVLNNETRTSLVTAFCSEITRYGWLSGVYLNQDYARNKYNMGKIKDQWEIWMAQYDTAKPKYNAGLKQYSSEAKVSGITGNVDVNESYIDYPTLIKASHYNGFESEYKSDTTNDETNPVLIERYKHYTLKITGADIDLVCGVSPGQNQAFVVNRCIKVGNARFWHITAIGEPGQEAGIYRKGHERICVCRVK